MSWHLKPPEQTSVVIPSRVLQVIEWLNKIGTSRFERYDKSLQHKDTSLIQHDREVIRNDNLDKDEEHFIGICSQAPQEEHISYDVCFCESCLNEARILEEEPLNKVRRSNKPKRSKKKSWEIWSTLGEPSGKWDYYVRYDTPPDITPIEEVAATEKTKNDWDDDERSGGKVLVIQERLAQNQQEFLDEYLPQWDENLAIQKRESESEWENPFAAKHDYQFGYPQGNIARSVFYQELDLDDNWDIVSADFDDISVYSISEGEGDTHQSISVMVQDTPVEKTVFMAIEDDESDDDREEEDNQFGHHAFMFHPGPPTKIAEMVQSVGSWKPDKELPIKSKECEHEWNENTVTNYTICYFCGILTTDMSRLNCPKCQLTTCALCARNYLGKIYYENKADVQKKEEIWQSKESLLVRDLTDALKIIDELRIEKERLEELRIEKKRLEEQKDKVIPEEALEPLTQTVVFNGLNSSQQATHKIKQSYFLIEENKFKIPLIYAFDMRDNNGIEMLIGANFLRSMKGGIRIEGDEITIYKKITKIKTSNQTEIAEITELEQGYIGEEPLKHWKKNGELCKLDIINPDITIEDRPLKHVTPAMEDLFRKHVDSLLKIGCERVKGKEREVFPIQILNGQPYKEQYSLPTDHKNYDLQENKRLQKFSQSFDLNLIPSVVWMKNQSRWTAF
ncbi:Orf y [Tanacetum coccineum]